MYLFIARHGQTVANLQGYYSGQSDVCLTALGKSQAEALRPLLGRFCFDRVYASDLTRAVDTARLALPGCEPVQTPLLREINTGSLTGQSIAGVRERYGRLKSDFTPFGGEDSQMLTARAAEFLRQIEAQGGEYVAAFSHNGFMKALLRCVIGRGADTAAFENGNCNVAVFHLTNHSWTLAAWNLAGII